MKVFFIIFIVMFSVNVYAEVKTIDCSVNTMVEFGISGAYIKHIKQEQGEDAFYTIADDQNNYSSNALSYAEQNKIKMIYVNLYEIDTVVFKNAKQELKVPTEGNDCTIWLCGKGKEPKKSMIIDAVENAQKYF